MPVKKSMDAALTKDQREQWLESLNFLAQQMIQQEGPDRAGVIWHRLISRLNATGLNLPSPVPTPSPTTFWNTSPGALPMAMRMPLSRRRWVTE